MAVRCVEARTVLLAFALAAVTLAGCIGNAGPAGAGDLQATKDPAQRTIPKAPDHDFSDALTDLHPHEIPELHTGHHNLELQRFDPMDAGLDPAGYGSGFSEVDVHDGLGVVASVEGQRAMTIFEVTDDGIEVLSHVYSGSENWDARISDDKQWIFVGCQGGGRYGALGGSNSPGGCLSGPAPQPPGHPDYHGSGIVAVDVSDPKSPEIAAYTPSAPVHNLYTTTLDGTIYVANHAGEIFSFDADAEKFAKLSEVDATHDLAIQEHPKTGDWLLYTGTEEGGLQIYDFDDPSDPVRLAEINEADDGTRIVGWHEQTPAPALIDGRHVTVVAGEQFGGQPGPVSVVDTTDPTDPKLLGQWHLPGEYTSQRSYKFSNHNVAVSADGQVTIGMYHGGAWVFDVSTTERMADPVTLAYYQPHEVNPKAGQQPSPYGVFTGSPYVWGTAWTDDGRLLVPDMNSGVYLLEPTWETTTLTD